MSIHIPYKLVNYERITTYSIIIGNTTIGGKAPIRVQSMCNVPTSDIEKSIAQAIEIIKAGGELIRYSVRHKEDANALKRIRKGLSEKGFDTPIIADVHFNAELAIIAAQNVEKVRINPGNFSVKRAKFERINYSEEMWKNELLQMETRLVELLNICKKNNTALRIGTNHGSLSDRIMSRYGNTVKGMVESTMEMLRICHKNQFFDVVVSLKSSNVRIMVQAYRNLVATMHQEQMIFPLHLGVTEAGNELSARIKSAAGIGTLLTDGIGDTIRVSLTENPTAEIPVAKFIVKHFSNRPATKVKIPNQINYNPFQFKKRKIQNNLSIKAETPAVIVDLRHLKSITEKHIKNIGYIKTSSGWKASRRSADFVFVNTTRINTTLPEKLKLLYESNIDGKLTTKAIPVLTKTEYMQAYKLLKIKEKWVYLRTQDLTEELIEILKNDQHIIIILETNHANGTADQRAFFLHLNQNQFNHPVIIKRNYVDDEEEPMAIKAATDIAPLFIDGFGDGIWLTNPFLNNEKTQLTICFEILQAARARNTVTEYIACPSCGRTQFEIENILQKIKTHTLHLFHLKIGIMGCIVNGPGEMADADYGYVGAAPDKIMLYKGKKAVRKNIPANKAVEELIQLIKDNGDWIEP